jgi:GT2 family glycosyltransferase
MGLAYMGIGFLGRHFNYQEQKMISIVSAYYKKEDMTRDFLDNLQKFLPSDVEVILVNAGSIPIEHSVVTKRIDLSENRSFSNSMNAGLREAKGDFVCVIGNDVFPGEGWLETLVELARATKAMITAPLNDKTMMETVVHEKQTENYYEPTFFPAVCWLLSRECIDKVGLFDEQFVIGTYEDNDYCRRVEKVGGKIVVSKYITVDHLLSQTMNQFDVQKAMHDNYDRFVKKWS